MNKIKQTDLLFGLQQENLTKSELEIKFGSLWKLDKYNEFDFYNENYFVELKSRRINHDKYSTIFFGENKLIKGLQMIREGWRVFFCWNCNDGIYCWELFDNIDCLKEYFIALGGRTDRGKDEIDRLVNVKKQYIVKLSDKVM